MADAIKAAGAGGAVLAALALAVTAIATWEGKRNAPYRDPIGILTVCYGETEVAMRRYSDAECRAMLERRSAQFMEGVRIRNPDIARYPHQWAAHTSFAYNVGLARYGRSSVAVLFERGRQTEACWFMGRYVYAGGRKLQGLVNRRAAETKLCLEDATDATAAAAPADANNTRWTSVDPPERFRHEQGTPFAAVFVDQVGTVCRLKPPPGKRILACVQSWPDGSRRMVLPNPCAFAAEESFAQTACHELAHVNGWSGLHEE